MSVPDSVCLSVATTPQVADILVAELADFGFDLFEFEGDDYSVESTGYSGAVKDRNPDETVVLKAYSTVPQWEVHADAVSDLIERYVSNAGTRNENQLQTAAGVSSGEPVRGAIPSGWLVSVIPQKNWNEAWEATIQPIRVPPFVIRPSWSAASTADGALIELLIDPKMSFGTGYHETTRLVLRAISKLVQPGQSVLDAGSGTGILAIASCKLGARRVVAFDFDEWCAINANENFLRNDCSETVTWYTGTMNDVPPDQFDVIVANINRNVLIEILPALKGRLRPGGHIVLAGLLRSDRDAMLQHIRTNSLVLANEDSEGEWWSAQLQAAE